MSTQNNKLYSDFFVNLDKHPISDDVAVKTNENAVKQSIRMLLLTDRGERPFQPDLGGDIRRLLFENVTPQSVTVAKQVIEDVLRTYEPRANILDVIITASPDENSMNITIVFSVINRQEPVSLEVVLNRVR